MAFDLCAHGSAILALLPDSMELSGFKLHWWSYIPVLGTSSTTMLNIETGTTNHVHHVPKLDLGEAEKWLRTSVGVSCEWHSWLGRRSQSLEKYTGGSVKRWVIGESQVDKPQPGHQKAHLC